MKIQTKFIIQIRRKRDREWRDWHGCDLESDAHFCAYNAARDPKSVGDYFRVIKRVTEESVIENFNRPKNKKV